MKKIMLSIFFMLWLVLPSWGGVSIFLAQDAAVAEKTAAQELKKELNKIFGIKAGILKSDLLKDVVNDAADAIATEFSQVKVHTLAYSITLPPPKNIVPRKNVMIEVATSPAAPSLPYPMPILGTIQIYPFPRQQF